MKSSKVFNNISDKLKAQIPKLKPGQQVVFKMLNGVPNPEPDEKERSKDPVLYGKVQLQTNMRIYDPYQLDSEKKEVGGFVDVGCVDQWNGEQPVTFRFFVPGQGMYSRFQGKFSLAGGVAKDEELYEILWLSPERKGSPCADNSITPLFEIVDLKADSTAAVTKYERLKKALDIVATMKADKAAEIMAALNQPSFQDEAVLMAKVKELASNNPDSFITTFESKETPIRATVKAALADGVLSHDLMTGEVKMGGTLVSTMKSESTDAFVAEFATWINTAQNGQDVLNNIKSRLEKKSQSPA
jgi:hypothetical protein